MGKTIDMFTKGVKRYNKKHIAFNVIVDALNKVGVFEDRTLERDIIRSKATLSRNGKVAYIRLTVGQAAILNKMNAHSIEQFQNKTYTDEEPEN